MRDKVDGIVAKYLELRDRRSENKAAFEAKDRELRGMMEKIEGYLHEYLVTSGLEQSATKQATVFKTRKEYFNVADWDSLCAYVKENDAWGLLEKRVGKNTAKEIMDADANGVYQNPPPPGVNYTAVETVQIRRK